MRKFYLIIPILILIVCSCEETISPFQSKNFIKFFGGGNGSSGASCIEIKGEGYILVGYDNTNLGKKQIYAVKTDLNGNIIWENWYNSEDSIQEGTAIKMVDSDNFIIVGNSKSTSASFSNPFLLKINRYGDQIWKKNFNVSYNLFVHDFAISNEYIFLVGESFKNSTTLSDTYIAKIDLSGSIVDSVTISAIRTELFKKIFIKENGNIVVIGNSNSNIGSNINMVTFTEFQPNSINNSNSYFNHNTQTDQRLIDVIYKNYQFSLLVSEYGTAGYSTRVLKLNEDYSLVWETELIPSFQGNSMAANPFGDIYAAGESSNQIQFVKIDSEGECYFGDEVYIKYPGKAAQIVNTTDNGLLIVGSTPSVYDNMVQLIKTGADLYLLKP